MKYFRSAPYESPIFDEVECFEAVATFIELDIVSR